MRTRRKRKRNNPSWARKPPEVKCTLPPETGCVHSEVLSCFADRPAWICCRNHIRWRVRRIRRRDWENLHIPHHSLIFVPQNVAVHDERSVEILVFRIEGDFLTWMDQHRVTPY